MYMEKEINKQNNSVYEVCVMCGTTTPILIETHIAYRNGTYVDGVGQLCEVCAEKYGVI